MAVIVVTRLGIHDLLQRHLDENYATGCYASYASRLEEPLSRWLDTKKLEPFRARVKIRRSVIKQSFKKLLGRGTILGAEIVRLMLRPELFGDLTRHLLAPVIVSLVIPHATRSEEVEVVGLHRLRLRRVRRS